MYCFECKEITRTHSHNVIAHLLLFLFKRTKLNIAINHYEYSYWIEKKEIWIIGYIKPSARVHAHRLCKIIFKKILKTFYSFSNSIKNLVKNFLMMLKTY